MKKQILSLFSVVIIPLSGTDWKDLQYSKLESNQVKLGEEEIEIKVDNTASPLFYTFSEPLKINKIKVKGQVEISKAIDLEKDDSYFQIGLIEKGHFKPGWIVKRFLPEWLNTLVELNDKKNYGIGNIYFYGINKKELAKDKEQSIQSLKLFFKEVALMNDEGKFELEADVKDGTYLGLWLRSDGDDSQAKFKTKVLKIDIIK